MKVTEEMLRRYEAECEKRDAEKQFESGTHMAAMSATTTASTPSTTAATQSPSAAMPPDDAATVDKEEHAAVGDSATADETADDGILEELTIPGIVINIGEINIGEANLDIHNAEHYESSAWMRDGFCGDDSCDSDDDPCVPDDGGYCDSDESDVRDGNETDDGGEDSRTSAVLSTEHHSVEVDQADMKDAISRILKIDRRTVEKVFMGMRLYLDALAEVLDEKGEPGESAESADDPDAREAQSASSKADTSRGVRTEGQCAGCGHRVSDGHSAEDEHNAPDGHSVVIPGIGCKITFSVHSVPDGDKEPDTDSRPDADSVPDGNSAPGCRMIRSTPESRAAAHLV